MIRVNYVDCRGSVVDGPGIRTVVFTQGCLRHCFHCHNPQTWDTQGGRLMREEDLAEEVIRGSPTKRVTISGGEPLLQTEAVIKLAGLLRRDGFEIALYTGYAREDVPEALLDVLDYLKTGEYIDSLRTTVTPYVGSKNQVFEKVSRNGEAQMRIVKEE